MSQSPDQAPPLGEQFNMVEIQRTIHEFSDQFGRLKNIPALAGSDRILEAIEGIKTELSNLRTELSNQITEVKTELTADLSNQIQGLQRGIRTNLQALNTNTAAQLINNQTVRARTHTIKVLVSVTTGEDIPSFPSNVTALMSLSSMFPPPLLLSHHG